MSKTNVDPLHTVYRLVFPNGKVYIGITSRFNIRMRQHKNAVNFSAYKHRPLFHAISKYGWENIKVEILHENLPVQEAYEAEIRLIKEHDSTNIEKGYNVALGGRTRLGKNKFPSIQIGRKLSEEHRQKLRDAKANKSYAHISSNNSTIYSVVAYNLITKEQTIYRNASVFGREQNISIYTVYNHISRGSRVLAKKWTVRYNHNIKHQVCQKQMSSKQTF